jgi:hypothetical protein
MQKQYLRSVDQFLYTAITVASNQLHELKQKSHRYHNDPTD